MYTTIGAAPSAKPSPGTRYYEAGSEEHLQDLIAAQDRARAQQRSPNWLLIGGATLAAGALAWYAFRD